MNDKNGMRIWDGDYVVGVGSDGKAYDGTVVGKNYEPPVVLVMDDDGRIANMNPRKVEIVEMAGAVPEPDCGIQVWPPKAD
jgi:hypothetical protein